jgi:hypothetical protein
MLDQFANRQQILLQGPQFRDQLMVSTGSSSEFILDSAKTGDGIRELRQTLLYFDGCRGQKSEAKGGYLISNGINAGTHRR